MADIDLQRNRKSGGWMPWILAALVAILVIWGLASLVARDTPVADDFEAEDVTAPAAEMGATADEAGPSAVVDYRRTCVDERTATPEIGPQHEYTVSCLESMAEAMDATIRADVIGDVVLDERLETLRQRAADVRDSDPSAVSHSATVAAAFDAGADLLETLQRERDADGIESEVRDVRRAADAIDAEALLLEQRDQVRDYFSAMAAALERLGTRTTRTP